MVNFGMRAKISLENLGLFYKTSHGPCDLAIFGAYQFHEKPVGLLVAVIQPRSWYRISHKPNHSEIPSQLNGALI